MKSELTYERDGYEFTIAPDGTLLQEYCISTGVTTKFFSDSKEVYYPRFRMIDHYRVVSRTPAESNWSSHDEVEYCLDHSIFIDEALVGLKVWYNRTGVPSSFAVGEVKTGDASVMHYSSRLPILDRYTHKVDKFISYWRDGRFYDISLFASKITFQPPTSQKSLSDKLTRNLTIK